MFKTIVVSIFFVLFMGALILLNLPATPDEIQKLAALASASPSASDLVKNELTKTPTPTHWDIGSIQKDVNKQLVLEKSRAITGDPTLTVETSKVTQEPPMSEDDKKLNDIMWLALRIAMGAVLVVFMVNFMLSMARNKG